MNTIYAKFKTYFNPNNQKGGAASDWSNSANSVYVDPRELSKLTLLNIDNSPMFHPLEPNRQIATPMATGIRPQGIYYMNQASKIQCKQACSCQGASCKDR